MRINSQKNVSFEDQPIPLLAEEAAAHVNPRAATKTVEGLVAERHIFLPGTPKIAIQEGKGEKRSEIKLSVSGAPVGKHAFPPALPVKSLPPLGNRRPDQKPLQAQGFLPDHLDRRLHPEPMPQHLVRPASQHGKRGNAATTIFSPDNRSVFFDTAYPWSTCGRVDTPGGSASGVMVGPRHLLTVSHTIQWNADNTAGWVQFRPSFFDGSAPFGEAWGSVIYSKMKVTGPTIDYFEEMSDYVVVVLNNRIGDLTGWMGSRGYTDGWDGAAYWAHVGYPNDLTAMQRPTFQNGIALDGKWYELDSHEAMDHTADVWPGQSGGPFFAWWANEGWPTVVAVQSSQSPSFNDASGGQDLVDLIIQARNEHP